MHHTADESGMPYGYGHHGFYKHHEEKEHCCYFHGVLISVCDGFLKIEDEEGRFFKIPFHDICKVSIKCPKKEKCDDDYGYGEEDEYFFHDDNYDDCYHGHHKEVKCWSKYDCHDKDHDHGDSVSRFVFVKGEWRRIKQPKKKHEPSNIEKLCSKLGCQVKVYVK